ncbi:MAG: hypothetical protein C4308_07010 [Chitinophagaceae bacterium]
MIYERTIQVQINIAGNGPAEQLESMLPKSRTDRFELNFGDNKSIWKWVEDEIENDEMSGNGMQIRMVGPGQDDIVFYDFAAARKVEQRELFDKKFIVADSIRKLNWKLTGDMQTILGHPCQKAVAQRTGKRMQMNMENGKMKRREVEDTTVIMAWYAMDIPVPAGPEVAGQLPGLIMALDINNGRMVYKAIDLSPKADIAAIKEPTKGKKSLLKNSIRKEIRCLKKWKKITRVPATDNYPKLILQFFNTNSIHNLVDDGQNTGYVLTTEL